MIARALAAAALLAAATPWVPAARADAPAREAAVAAVESLRQELGALDARWKADRPLPHRLSGFASRPYAGDARVAAAAFLADVGPRLGVDPAELAVSGVERTRAATAVRFTRSLDGVPVLDATVVVTVDAAGRATSVTGLPQPLELAPRLREIDAPVAIDAALAALGVQPAALPAPASASKAILAAGTEGRLVWCVRAAVVPLAWHMRVLVDAETAEVLAISNEARHD